MKTHSQGFKDEICLLGKQQELKLIYTNNNEEITLTGENIYSANFAYKADLLKSVMKEIDLEVDTDIPVNTIFNIQYGLLVNNQYEYLNFGNYVVFSSEKQEDKNTYKLKCYDKIIYSMKPYENMNITYPITIRNYINALCSYLGLTFANINDTFTNYEKEIPYELYLTEDGNDIGYTFRDVLDELAQVTASVICINDEDKLEIRYINNTNDTINEEYLKDINVNFGEKYGPINTVILSRSEGADKIAQSVPSNLPDNEKIAIEIKDNQIMNFNNRDEYLSAILNKLYGIEYYLNDFTSTGICYYDLMDRYFVQIGENTYNCLMLNNEINVTQGLQEIVYTEMPETSETDYTKTDKTDRKINQTYLIVDKQNQRIDSVVNNVTEQNNKISQITQTVDELNTKIQDIADITISGESIQASVNLDNINESEPIELRVHPITNNISYLYPYNTLYPSDTLFMPDRIIRFIRTYEEEGIVKQENIDYLLPDDLLYYNSEIYDEFYLNYDSQTCQVIKKCKYNADGTVGLLSQTITTDYTYPLIQLKDGDYQVKILGHNIGYISVRLMASNIYTSQFATKVEVSSQINQTATQINLEVSKKVGNDEIISKINQSAEAVQIEADKIALDGKNIDLTADNITIDSDNFSVDKYGNINCNNGNFNDGYFNGNINIGGDESNPKFTCTDGDAKVEIWPGTVWVEDDVYNTTCGIQKYGFFARDSDGDESDYNSYGIRSVPTYNSTQSGSANLRVGSDGHFHRATGSSKRWKRDITEQIDENLNPELLYKLPVKQFKYNKDYLDKKDKRYNKNIIGFIAEDVQEIYEIATEYDEDGKVEMWNSDVMIPAMLKLIQQQHNKIENLQKQIDELKGDK